MPYKVRSDDHSNHNLPVGAEVELLRIEGGVALFTQGGVGDEVAIDLRDLDYEQDRAVLNRVGPNPVRRVKRFRDVEYQHVGVDTGHFDDSLVLTVRDPHTYEVTTEIRIATDEISDFLQAVTRHSMYALDHAARQLEAGHCERCRNRRTIDIPHPQRGTENVKCPDCLARVPSTGFGNVPQIGDTRED